MSALFFFWLTTMEIIYPEEMKLMNPFKMMILSGTCAIWDVLFMVGIRKSHYLPPIQNEQN